MLERELGRGGMATVYAAHDVKHDRQVALKVLHPELAASLGPERFEREIRFTAQLQHPHILPVHDSGEAAGRLYYVMPYVQGESLRQRLAREGELPVAESVRLLCEIVEALAYAHAQGVVHRDIKPDNIMLSGRHALLADLGVAKAVHAAEREGEALTSTGIALGTPRYMAPEQVAADPHVDHRADIYAVGVMAYEMLAGTPPFSGVTPQAVFSAQVTQTPTPLETLRPGISPLLSQTIAKCLTARPADRWQSAAELLAQLERLQETGAVTISGGSPAPAAPRRTPRALIWGMAAAAAAAAAVAVAVLVVGRRPEAEIRFGARTPLTVEPGLEIDPAVSPDGQFIAYTAGPLTDSKIYVRQVDGGRPIAVAADVAGAQRLPHWSPDGKRILFRTTRGIEIAPALGGPPKVLVPRAGQAPLLPGPWSPDGQRVAFARSDSLFVMPAGGGAPTLLAAGGDMHSFAWSPDGRWIAAVRGNRMSVDPDIRWFFGNRAQSAVWLIPVHRDAEPVPVTDDRSFHASPLWLPGGRALLFLSDAEGGLDVYRVPLDPSGATSGGAERVTIGLNAHAISMDAAGRRLAYEMFEERSNVWSLPLPARPPVGLADAVPVTSGSQVIESFDVSPDRRWLTFDSDRSGVAQIYRVPLSGGEAEQLTGDSTTKFWPRWSPDGLEIAYHGFRQGRRRLFLMGADGGAATELPTGDGDERTAEWRRDGHGLYYLHNYDSPTSELRFIPRDAGGRWGSPVTIARMDALVPALSNDLRWLAFGSDHGLMLTTSSGDSARVLVPGSYRSRDLRPTYVSWSSDSRTLYYLALDSLDRATIWGVAPTTGERTLLVRFDGEHEWHRFGFAASGSRVYFTLGDRQSDLWMTSIEKGR